MAISPDLQAAVGPGVGLLLVTHGRLGALITDVFGSTPANIAARLNRPPHTQLVAGLNLPMMLRVLNYASLDLIALGRAAVEGGQRGIVACCAAGAAAP